MPLARAQAKHDVDGQRRRRIFLLTPYTGANLGDQAIQLSFVANLTRRCPNAEFVGITQNPRATAAAHGFPCFPLSPDVALRHGGVRLQLPQPSMAAQIQHGFRARVRELPLVRSGLRVTSRILKSLLRLPREFVFTASAARLLRQGDLLVVAGGGQLDEQWGGPWAHPFALWRWTAIARVRGCRIAVVSVGWGKLNSAAGKRLTAGALRRADYRSYRDEGSVVKAASIGCVNADEVVPDIAFALPLPPERMHAADRPIGTVGISPIAFARQGTWPVADAEVYSRYLQELAAFVAGITARGLRVLLYTTGRMDRATVTELVSRVRESPDAKSDLIEVADTSTVERLLDALATCDLVVASRLHGVILAHRLVLPTLAISFDRKVAAHMGDVGHTQFCLDIRRFDRAGLQASFEELTARAGQLSAELQAFLDRAQPPLARQFDRLAELACPQAVRGPGW